MTQDISITNSHESFDRLKNFLIQFKTEIDFSKLEEFEKLLFHVVKDQFCTALATNTIHEEITQQVALVLDFFHLPSSHNGLLKSSRYITQHKISLSFLRGSLSRYLSISGLVKGEKNHQVKLSFTANNDEKIYHYKQNCDCLTFEQTKSCEHLVALFIFYFFQENHVSSTTDANTHSTPYAQLYPIISPCFLGENLNSPSDFSRNLHHNYFHHLQYQLLNKKIIS